MSDTKHTPGPWKANGGEASLWVYPMGRRDDNAICDIVPRHCGKPITEEDEANARLIAAAPDLLAELKDILLWATTERAPLREREIESIRRVIAKANG